MEGLKIDNEPASESEKLDKNESVYNVLRQNTQEQILTKFTKEEQEEILRKKQVLSSLAYFIGKDFRIPVELNQPGAGWHWDFKANIIRVDPKDLLEKSMDYLRFVISHEGGHRRISRTSFIPKEVWKQKGFSFLLNAVEDPRDNNFVAESYPRFLEQMDLVYTEMVNQEKTEKEKAQEQLGYQPRFMQAGFEYIRQWFRERQGQEFEISADLPDEVKAVILKTLESAKDSWWRFPSREEADESEEKIVDYAKMSYEINLEEIWPEFKKLVEMDLEDQKMMEALKEILEGKQNSEDSDGDEQKNGTETEGGGDGASRGEEENAKKDGTESKLPKELKDKLTEEEKKALEDAISKAIDKANADKEKKEGGAGDGAIENEDAISPGENGAGAKSIDLNSLSDEIKQKIRDYINSLPEEKKDEIKERAEKALKEFEDKLNDELRGKMSENPGKKESVEEGQQDNTEETSTSKIKEPVPESDELKKFKEKMAKELQTDANIYEAQRREVMPLIQKLENDLREIFVERRTNNWKTGFKTGKKIDIKKRIQEKAKGVSAVDSRSWQKREAPEEKDYSISILVDLSGSMDGPKIEETFKAVIVLAEVLNKLSINVEILGFNNVVYEYQNFGQQISKKIRENMGKMLEEVYSHGAGWNDDGWAVEQASERLKKQKTDHNFLIVLSDGEPVESSQHRGPKYELSSMVTKILKESNIKIIGLGIGAGTGHVSRYYPNSIADVGVTEMADRLADLIKEVIVKYNKF